MPILTKRNYFRLFKENLVKTFKHIRLMQPFDVLIQILNEFYTLGAYFVNLVTKITLKITAMYIYVEARIFRQITMSIFVIVDFPK